LKQKPTFLCWNVIGFYKLLDVGDTGPAKYNDETRMATGLAGFFLGFVVLFVVLFGEPSLKNIFRGRCNKHSFALTAFSCCIPYSNWV